ncbi:hypothetical protein ACWEWX_25125, partial [Streptomyces asiaticus]
GVGHVVDAGHPATEDLVRAADVEEGCRAIGFTLGTPGPSQLGVVEGILVDRAFVADRQRQAQELAEVSDVTIDESDARGTPLPGATRCSRSAPTP